MQPVKQKAAEHIVSISGIQDIIVCPDHPENWIEEQYTLGKLLDTTEFCHCCIGDCSDYCKICNRTLSQILDRHKKDSTE
jgi:hypothetical protein